MGTGISILEVEHISQATAIGGSVQDRNAATTAFDPALGVFVPVLDGGNGFRGGPLMIDQ